MTKLEFLKCKLEVLENRLQEVTNSKAILEKEILRTKKEIELNIEC